MNMSQIEGNAGQERIGITDTKRKSYLDALRIFACFLVIFNHLPGYELYQSAEGVSQWIYMFITMFTRINVPLFFMISGTLLLSKEEPLEKILKHRVFRIAVVTVVSGTLLYIAYHPWDGGIKEWLRQLIKGDVTFAYWYLYAYLGLLLMLPFMRKIAKGFGKQEFIYLLVLQVCICSVYPALSYIAFRVTGTALPLCEFFSVPLVQISAFFYPLMGYYLDRVLCVETLKKKQLLLLAAAAVLGILITSGFTYAEGTVSGKFTENFVDLFTYLTSITVFILTKYLFVTKWNHMRNGVVKVLGAVSSLTFGIYLLDPFLQHWIFWPFVQSPGTPAMPAIVTSIGWCIFSMGLGGCITYLLKKSHKLL